MRIKSDQRKRTSWFAIERARLQERSRTSKSTDMATTRRKVDLSGPAHLLMLRMQRTEKSRLTDKAILRSKATMPSIARVQCQYQHLLTPTPTSMPTLTLIAIKWRHPRHQTQCLTRATPSPPKTKPIISPTAFRKGSLKQLFSSSKPATSTSLRSEGHLTTTQCHLSRVMDLSATAGPLPDHPMAQKHPCQIITLR